MSAGEKTRVKICGITSLADARMAIDAGADMLGFNFYPKSPRFITPQAARDIARQVDGEAECVGVFVNEVQPQDVLATVDFVGLETAQLHGNESPEYCTEVRRRCAVIKALRVGEGYRPEAAAQYGGRVLLDTATTQFGGSGKTFDWSLAADWREHVVEVILAGGLRACNVGDAIAIARPSAVDACSGLEKVSGEKDRDKVMAFMAAVRASDEQRKEKVRSA